MNTVRTTLAGSTLAAAGGLLVMSLADATTMAAIAAEALACRGESVAVDLPEAALGGEERGQPERRLASAPGGPVLAAFFTDPATVRLLELVTGVVFEPLGNQGTYSYYRDLDFLGVHRDAPSCHLAVITCIRDDGGPGGVLEFYPGRIGEPMRALRADPYRGVVRVRLEPGQSAILLGGIIAHRATPPRARP